MTTFNLNPRQQEAVNHNDGPALVLAGAGTGKTRVITSRIIRLLREDVSPFRIMAVTFTRKAANEMNQRISDSELSLPIFAGGRSLPWCGTFHSLAVRFMSQHSGERFSVMDEEDSKDLLYRIFEEIGDKKKKSEVAEIIKTISYSRNTGADLFETVRVNLLPYDEEQIEEWAYLYDSRKKERGLKDFDDLLIHWRDMLKQEADNGNFYFDHILVDEYQDTNRLQDEIIDQLSRMTKNVMVVGDDAQSIYGFRGSCVENILTFGERYPECKVIPLEENYRSVQSVLNLSNALWNESSVGMKKELHAVNKTKSNYLPVLSYCKNEFEQVDKVIRSIRSDYHSGSRYSDQAVLFRSAYQAIKLEMELRKNRIPYKKYGGRSIADAAHVKDLQAILRTVCSRVDEPAWIRFLKLLPGVGDKTAVRIFQKISAEQGSDPFAKLTPKERKAVEDFTILYSEPDLFGEAGLIDRSPEKITEMAFSKYIPLMMKKYDKADNREKELEQFVTAAVEYKDLQDFLNAYFLNEEDFSDNSDRDFLTLSTIHSAKGCEWDKVMVIGLANGSFPSSKSMESGGLEEERRLMYVAFTRAAKKLQLYFPKQSTIHKGDAWITLDNEMSCFLSPDVCQYLNTTGTTKTKPQKDLYSYEDNYYDFDDF